MIMLALLLATPLQTPPAGTTPPPAQSPAEQEAVQANAQAAIEGMERIYTTVGSCERHLSPAQVRAVRSALEPESGQQPNRLQAYMEAAYQRGREDQTRSAEVCQAMMRALSESKAPN